MACGEYHEMVSQALDILRHTDAEILAAYRALAWHALEHGVDTSDATQGSGGQQASA